MKTVEKSVKPAKTLVRFLKKVMGHPDYAAIIKTALDTGYLSDGQWVVRLTAEDLQYLKGIRRTIRGFRNAEVLADPRRLFPRVVGSVIASLEPGRDASVFDFSGKKYRVHSLLPVLITRHPHGSVHFATDKQGFIFISEGNQVVGCVPILP